MKSCALRPQPLKFLPKKFPIFLPKKTHCERFLTFSQKKAFPIFSQMKRYTFYPKLEKLKISTRGKSFILQETKTPKKVLVLSIKKAFLVFQETEIPKKKLYFRKRNFSSYFRVRYFVFILLYRECYGFERDFFTLRRFLSYTLSRHLAQPTFTKAFLGSAVQP